MTPVPNNIILASGANFGTRRCLPHLSGIALGFAFMLAAVGLGLGVVFLTNTSLQTAMRVAGLDYWPWRIATAQGLGDAGAAPQPLTFVQAALFQLVSRKAWILVHRVGEAMLLNVPVLALICLVVNLPSVAIWLLLRVGLRRLLACRRRCAASTSP